MPEQSQNILIIKSIDIIDLNWLVGINFFCSLIVTGIRNPGVGESPIALPHAGIARHEAVAWQESAAGLDQQWTQWHDSSSPLQSFASWTSKLIPASHSRLEDICILAPTQKRIVSFETKYPQGPKSQLFLSITLRGKREPCATDSKKSQALPKRRDWYHRV